MRCRGSRGVSVVFRIMLASVAALMLFGCGAARGPVQAAAEDTAAERGRYLVTIMDCGGCHDTGALGGRPTAPGALGGANIGFEVGPTGVFYPPNLTPHPETGLGRWSQAEIVTALRTGVRPDGRVLSPVMPWRAYAALTDEDVQAVATYLRSLPPVDHRSPAPTTAAQATAPFHRTVVPESAAARS